MTEQLTFTLRLPAHAVSPAVARGALQPLRRLVDAAAVVEAAELVLSELVTNSIRHGSPRADDVVDVEITIAPHQLFAVVRDSGPPFRLGGVRRAPDQSGGFGLHIARELSDVTVERGEGGNVVSFTVPIDGQAAVRSYRS